MAWPQHDDVAAEACDAGLAEAVLTRDGSYAWKLDPEQELRDRVATLLAFLEITKVRLAFVSQRRPFGTIILKKR